MSDQEPIAESVAQPRHDLGILLVHGIGHQGQGDTLRGFGLPLMRWLKRWLEHPEDKWLRAQLTTNAIDEWLDRKVGGDKVAHWKNVFQGLCTAAGPAPSFGAGAKWVSVEEIARTIGYPTIAANVRFSDAARENTAEGANATLHIQLLDVDEGPKKHSWLLRESWWATSFRAPGTLEFLSWCLRVVPWVVVAHFARRIVVSSADLATDDGSSASAKWARLFVASFWLWVSPLLALLVLLLVSVLGLPGVTRIPVVGSWAASVMRTLLETVGDSRALVQNEIDAVQITTAVRSDLDVLAATCNKVAVVAHSQGAAVAHAALLQRENEGKPPVDLLLTFGSGLRKLHELSAPERVAPVGYALGYLAVFGMISGFLGLFDPFQWLLWTRALAGAGGLVVFLAGLGPILKLVAAESPFLSAEVRNSKAWATWEDLYATHDPVPNGRLFLIKDSPLGSRKVYNRASVWSDHSTYWDNFDHFVGMIVAELTRQSSIDPSTEPRLRESIAQAFDQREWRVRWLQSGRGLVLAVWIGACYHAAGLSAVVAVPVIGGHGPMATALGITLCTVAAGLAYAVATWTWRRWDDADTAKLFRREAYARYSVPFLCFAGIVGSTLGIGVWFQTWAGTAATVDQLLAWAVGGFALGLISALCSPWLSRKRSRVMEQQMRRRGAMAPRNK